MSPLPSFDELQFSVRPDLTPYLIHLTKNTRSENGNSAYANLVSILKEGKIRGSEKDGMIKGEDSATCFMDVPFASFKYVLTPNNTNPQKPRYEPYGIALRKEEAYFEGCRPVLYLSKKEESDLDVPDSELWRIVRFEGNEKGWISWLHEREWRCKGDFILPPTISAVFVRNTKRAQELTDELYRAPKGKFKCVPKSVIPFSII